ncbi:hypothetical protein [Agromyces badenianii]|uniref:hypothetical protein n=1 Tax=Agromyces badenianii TaxID=2080742 RepID=UPI0010593F0E|nr:hypothetical protein [Agromyces badenianii]
MRVLAFALSVTALVIAVLMIAFPSSPTNFVLGPLLAAFVILGALALIRLKEPEWKPIARRNKH